MIKVNSLSKTFNKGKKNSVDALQNISLELPETGIVAIFGKSGSGKSTLLNMIGGLDSYDKGSIQMQDNTYNKMVDDKYRIDNIGYIFQNYCLDPLVNVYENVARGLRTIGVNDEEVIFTRVMTALKNVDMVKYFKRNIDTLSGGQQQRVAIARAMVKGAKIILADEPTGNLDENNTRMIMDILKEMSKTCLVILVTHEQDIIDKYADSIIEIKDGKIISTREGEQSLDLAHDKTKIFLGDLTKKSISQVGIDLQLYGDDDMDINIKIACIGGKYYLSSNINDLIYVNDKSEVQMINSTKQEYFEKSQKQTRHTLESLGAVQAKSSGKIFDFATSYKEGLKSVFAKKAHWSKLLFITIVLFTLVITILTSSFSAQYKSYQSIYDNYNIDYIILPVDNYQEKSDIVNIAKDYGYQYDYLSGISYTIQKPLTITPASFESIYASSIDMLAYYMDTSMLEGKTFVCGAKPQKVTEVVLSQATADVLLANIKQQYSLKDIDYEYLLDFEIDINEEYQQSITYTFKIVGVVQEDKSFVYYDDIILNVAMNRTNLAISLDEIYGAEVPDGCILIPPDRWDDAESIASATGLSPLLGTNDDIYSCLANRNYFISKTQEFDSESGYDLVVYAQDSKALAQAIQEKYPSKQVVSNIYLAEQDINEGKQSLIGVAITTLVLMCIMFLCIYLLVYSTIIGRIKEIAVYRCIGVSKQNIIFKFLAEGVAILTTAVLPVIFIISLIILWVNFYLTFIWWIWLIFVIVTSGLMLLMSILPVIRFMRHTPIQLLSKYDL